MNLTIKQSDFPDPITIPVGAILPFIGTLNDLPANWQLCDGRLINNGASPFDGKRLPILNDDRFPMGVEAAASVCEYGGNNGIPNSGQHAHNGLTNGFGGYQAGHINYDRGPDRPDPYMIRFGIDADGNHNHGGENRSLFCGVYFIIRIF
jgi:hypothetical protein